MLVINIPPWFSTAPKCQALSLQPELKSYLESDLAAWGSN
jgi:hypothetical protein